MAIDSTYVVIDTDLITNDMVNESIGSETSFRQSLDGTKSILKFNVKYPNTMDGHVKYDYDEIAAFLIENAADWTA